MSFLDNMEREKQKIFQESGALCSKAEILVLCNLLSWSNLFIENTTLFQSILLIGWGRIEGGSVFVFPILFGALWGQCIHRVYFGAPFLVLLYKYYSHLFIIKNETEFVSVFLSYNIVFLFGDFPFFSPPKILEWKAFR